MKIPFDIKYRPQIESGEYKVETRSGLPARIVCWDRNSKDMEILALVYDEHIDENNEELAEVALNGRMFPRGKDHDYDLFIVTPEEEMTEFEKAVGLVFTDAQLIPRDKDGIANIHDINEFIKKKAAELLILAKEECKNQIESDYREIIHGVYEKGKADALNDLPRWRRWENGTAGNSAGHPIALVSGAGGIRFVSVLGTIGEKYIMLDDLEKLPGFDNN